MNKSTTQTTNTNG